MYSTPRNKNPCNNKKAKMNLGGNLSEEDKEYVGIYVNPSKVKDWRNFHPKALLRRQANIRYRQMEYNISRLTLPLDYNSKCPAEKGLAGFVVLMLPVTGLMLAQNLLLE